MKSPMIKKSLIGTFLLLLSQNSYSLPSPCGLLGHLQKNTSATLKRRDASEVNSFLVNLQNECALERKFVNLKNQSTNYNIKLDYISVYRALRYIERTDYREVGKKENMPVEKIYQRKERHYRYSADRRSDDLWRNWDKGIAQLSYYDRKLNSGSPIVISDLQDVQKGFYQVSDERGDFAEDPKPGKLKEPNNHEDDSPWWKFKNSSQEQDAAYIVEKINAKMNRHNLLPEVYETDSHGKKLNQLLFIHRNGIYAADTRYLYPHLEKWLEFYNNYLDIYSNYFTEGISDSYPLLTPMQLAAFTQQWYIMLHFFFEGNGRTSRFWQDLILKQTSLPYASSGDLMLRDVLTPHDEYYEAMFSTTDEVMDQIGTCFNEVYPRYRSIPIGSSSNLPYECRIIEEN